MFFTLGNIFSFSLQIAINVLLFSLVKSTLFFKIGVIRKCHY